MLIFDLNLFETCKYFPTIWQYIDKSLYLLSPTDKNFSSVWRKSHGRIWAPIPVSPRGCAKEYYRSIESTSCSRKKNYAQLMLWEQLVDWIIERAKEQGRNMAPNWPSESFRVRLQLKTQTPTLSIFYCSKKVRFSHRLLYLENSEARDYLCLDPAKQRPSSITSSVISQALCALSIFYCTWNSILVEFLPKLFKFFVRNCRSKHYSWVKKRLSNSLQSDWYI